MKLQLTFLLVASASVRASDVCTVVGLSQKDGNWVPSFSCTTLPTKVEQGWNPFSRPDISSWPISLPSGSTQSSSATSASPQSTLNNYGGTGSAAPTLPPFGAGTPSIPSAAETLSVKATQDAQRQARQQMEEYAASWNEHLRSLPEQARADAEKQANEMRAQITALAVFAEGLKTRDRKSTR